MMYTRLAAHLTYSSEMRKTVRHKLILIALGFGVTIAGLIVTSGTFLENTFEDHSALGIIVIVFGAVLLAMLVTYNKTIVRLIALLFPVLMILTAVFNLTEEKVGWRLLQKSSNTLFALSEPSKEHQLYAYLQDNFTGWTLLATPTTLEASGLAEWKLLDWGNLASVQLESHNLTLLSDDFAALLDHPHVLITHQKRDYIVIDPQAGSENSAHTLVLLRDAERSFLIPADRFPALEGDSK